MLAVSELPRVQFCASAVRCRALVWIELTINDVTIGYRDFGNFMCSVIDQISYDKVSGCVGCDMITRLTDPE